METPPSERGPERASRKPALWVRAIFSAGILAVLLVPLELVARARYAPRYERLHAGDAGQPVRRDQFELLDLIEPAPERDVIFELRPSLSGRFKNASYRSNALGMRDAEIAPEKPQGTLRLALLGDSFTFGWGVEVEQGFANLLESLLPPLLGGRRVETLNFGVPGYNTAIEAACLEHRAMALHPDLVLVCFYFNDVYLPNFVLDERARPSSYLVEWIRDRLGLRQPPQPALVRPSREGPADEGDEGVKGLPADDLLADWRRDSSLVPAEYAHMVGIEGVERALTRMRSLTDAAGIPLAVFVISRPSPAVMAAAGPPPRATGVDGEMIALCERLSIPVIESLQPTVLHLRATGLTVHDLILSDQDWHPNPPGHELYGRIIVEGLERAGLLKR